MFYCIVVADLLYSYMGNFGVVVVVELWDSCIGYFCEIADLWYYCVSCYGVVVDLRIPVWVNVV